MAWNRDVWVSVIVRFCLRIGIFLIPRSRVPRRACPLIEAVKRGDTEEVRSLLAQGADPNTRETQVLYRRGLGREMVEIPETMAKTTLMLAASEGHKDIVELLLDSGAEVDAKAAYGSTALMQAVGREGHAEIAKMLIDRGADVNAHGFEPSLTIAATGQRIDLVKLLLDSGADVNARDDEGYTALMEPADYGYKDVVEVLIAAGIDVNARSNEGFTALRYAKEKKRTQIVDLLVRAGARE
jgi:ankyrin repeat protein